jgi:peptidoglycan/xylan/chitin deacetylase (PgdA/CDA1 family)
MKNLLKPLPKKRVLILLYHQIDKEANVKYYSNFVSKESFEKQIAFLRKQDYHFLALENLADLLEGNRTIPSRSVIVTFDDAYLDNLTNAWPILKHYGATGTIFAVTDFIGKSFTWNEQENSFLTGEQITEMHDQGMEFGSHTLTHPSLTRCPLEKVIYEVTASKARLEELLNHPVHGFAYPYGSYNQDVKGAVIKAGYRLAFTMHRGMNTMESDPFTLRRMRPTNSFLKFLFIVHAAALIENLRKFKTQ